MNELQDTKKRAVEVYCVMRSCKLGLRPNLWEAAHCIHFQLLFYYINILVHTYQQVYTKLQIPICFGLILSCSYLITVLQIKL